MHSPCQCPMSGKPHFYETKIRNIPTKEECVNALCRASLISTDYNSRAEGILLCVSMPYVGQASFLPIRKIWDSEIESGVNALCRASLISTSATSISGGTYTVCQCPMSGKPHFYETEREKQPTRMWVSMPYVGQASFLLKEKLRKKDTRHHVSMPYVGQASFLPPKTSSS